MKFRFLGAAAALIAFAAPAAAQMPGSAPATLPGTTTRDNAAAAGAAVPGGPAMSSKSPAQNGTSPHDNSTGNNSTSSADGPTGTPVTKSSMSPGSGREPSDTAPR